MQESESSTSSSDVWGSAVGVSGAVVQEGNGLDTLVEYIDVVCRAVYSFLRLRSESRVYVGVCRIVERLNSHDARDLGKRCEVLPGYMPKHRRADGVMKFEVHCAFTWVQMLGGFRRMSSLFLNLSADRFVDVPVLQRVPCVLSVLPRVSFNPMYKDGLKRVAVRLGAGAESCLFKIGAGAPPTLIVLKCIGRELLCVDVSDGFATFRVPPAWLQTPAPAEVKKGCWCGTVEYCFACDSVIEEEGPGSPCFRFMEGAAGYYRRPSAKSKDRLGICMLQCSVVLLENMTVDRVSWLMKLNEWPAA